jgi:mannitol/fructose-specific phosphotransferase system IIA component (Ntr-type)
MHTPHNIIEHTHSKILVIALERQVSWDDNIGEVVDHLCNLAHSSKHGK